MQFKIRYSFFLALCTHEELDKEDDDSLKVKIEVTDKLFLTGLPWRHSG